MTDSTFPIFLDGDAAAGRTLAQAIAKAAKASGIYNGEAPLNGPMLEHVAEPEAAIEHECPRI